MTHVTHHKPHEKSKSPPRPDTRPSTATRVSTQRTQIELSRPKRQLNPHGTTLKRTFSLPLRSRRSSARPPAQRKNGGSRDGCESADHVFPQNPTFRLLPAKIPLISIDFLTPIPKARRPFNSPAPRPARRIPAPKPRRISRGPVVGLGHFGGERPNLARRNKMSPESSVRGANGREKCA